MNRSGCGATSSRWADDAAPLNKLANVQARMGAHAKALETARRAFDKVPGSPLILDTYGALLVHAGKAEEGLGLLQRASEALTSLAPADAASLRFHLADALSRVGKIDAALQQLDIILGSKVVFPEREDAKALKLRLKLLGLHVPGSDGEILPA